MPSPALNLLFSLFSVHTTFMNARGSCLSTFSEVTIPWHVSVHAEYEEETLGAVREVIGRDRLRMMRSGGRAALPGDTSLCSNALDAEAMPAKRARHTTDLGNDACQQFLATRMMFLDGRGGVRRMRASTRTCY